MSTPSHTAAVEDVGAASTALPRPKGRIRETIEVVVVALMLALVIRTFVVQAFKIPSGSMLPTLLIGDHLLVNKFLYGMRFEIPFTDVCLGRLPGLRNPVPGDVIVFLAPASASGDGQRKDFIKRVVAVEGQTVEVRRKRVYVDGVVREDAQAQFVSGAPVPNAPPDPNVRPCGSVPAGASGVSCAPYTVPPGHVFVMGDNRDQSFDSRFWGPVPVADIKGQAFVIYWSWDSPRTWFRWERLARLVG